VTYWPRESWVRLVRQFQATGTWRGELVRRYGRRNSLRFFAPPLLVLALMAAVIVAVLQLTGVVGGMWAMLLSAVYLPVAAYALLIAVVALSPRPPRSWRDRLWTAVVVPSMHVSWGAGFLAGILRGARDTVDTSRLSRNTPLP
jgi:hypothetical protein